MYLVSRLDGFTPADVNGLIDRGAAPVRTGAFLLDSMGPDAERIADGWLRSSAAAITAAGYPGRVELDTAPAAVRTRSALLGYASWGSNDPQLRTRRIGPGFAPGALATLLVSSDARTVREPPATWQPSTAVEPASSFEGSPQSLSADLIRDGVTGVAGYIAEPFLDGTLRPDILFPAYVAGFNLIEAFYLATPSLSWRTIVFGDPLCAPFRNRALLPEDTRPALDAETELPVYFSQRRVALLTSTGFSSAAVKLMLKGEGRRRVADLAGARRALEEATTLEPRLLSAQRTLAAVYQELGEHNRAIERWRRVLAEAPDDLLSLNNLAYALAVHQKAAAEALPLAQQAYALSKGSIPSVTDTLGWIHHLLGQFAEAEKYLSEAATAAPDNADVQLHLAQVYVARGRMPLAARALARAVQLDPALAERADVKELRARLAGR
jgi:Tfp pilus assembly protein PilF